MANEQIKKAVAQSYPHGFVTDIESDRIQTGLNEGTIATISKKKNEPEFMLQWRLKAYHYWTSLTPPTWANVEHPPIDFQSLCYYSAPKSQKDNPKSLDEVDPKLLHAYEKLGIPLHEQKMLAGVAVDAVFDSVSVATTCKEQLEKAGVLFCPISEAVQKHPELIQKYLGSVVSYRDNFYAALNAAVFSDGSFVYVPKGVRCPLELSTYFRINALNTGQFERTLIIADADSYVSYLEGCTAPMRDENQLHAAVVELVAHDNAQIKYATVQNWYPGDENGKGGIYNFVTKRGLCQGHHAKISWTQIETGSAITWKYPSVILKGNYSQGEFYSVAMTKHYQQADTGTKMIHVGQHTRSKIIAKSIAAGHSKSTYRSLVHTTPRAQHARNYTQCDTLMLGNHAYSYTLPQQRITHQTAQVEHEASTSKIGESQLFYCHQRGFDAEQAIGLIVNGFCQSVFKKLPMEFAVEAHKLMELNLEDCIG